MATNLIDVQVPQTPRDEVSHMRTFKDLRAVYDNYGRRVP